jgi:DNA polymerase III epsilon subunit-like protein
MRYVSIDIETLGLDPKTCNLIEFGAVIDDTSKMAPLDELPVFHRYILPKSEGKDGIYSGQVKVMSFHGQIFDKIANYGPSSDYICIPPARLGQEFARFLIDNGVIGQITPAGKQFASFDLSFLMEVEDFQKYVGLERTNSKASVVLAKRCIDPGLLFWNPDKDVVLPSTNQCLERAKIDVSSDHTSVADAFLMVRLVRKHCLLCGKS